MDGHFRGEQNVYRKIALLNIYFAQIRDGDNFIQGSYPIRSALGIFQE
jgi:hypothetical protein